jgi:mono/diheme cytochrome c family protein
MKLRRLFFGGIAAVVLIGASLLAATNQPVPGGVATAPVYVPDTSHRNDPLPDGILNWDSTSKETNISATASTADFVFSFTNVSASNVVVLSARGSCHCTVAKLPPVPWMIPSGSNGQIAASIDLNLTGRSGTLFKTITVSTDKGSKLLMLKVVIQPLVFTNISEMERARFVAITKVDRQAVFHGDCASCHVKLGEGKYGKALYDADCGICHEAEHRATIVPDLHNLKTPTNDEFWRIWIAHGKPGSMMPAFSQTDGGPLNDMQIASLVSYLGVAMPSRVPLPPQ